MIQRVREFHSAHLCGKSYIVAAADIVSAVVAASYKLQKETTSKSYIHLGYPRFRKTLRSAAGATPSRIPAVLPTLRTPATGFFFLLAEAAAIAAITAVFAAGLPVGFLIVVPVDRLDA